MQKELCTREEIIEDLWRNSLYIDENTLYVNVNRLRDKLKKMGAEEYIRTVREWGIAYEIQRLLIRKDSHTLLCLYRRAARRCFSGICRGKRCVDCRHRTLPFCF